MRRRVFPFVGPFVGFVAITFGCLSATQITVRITTNAPCSATDPWQGVALYVGTPGAGVEGSDPVLTTTTCNAGLVGTVVLVPSKSNDEDVGVRVVAGISRKPEDCRTASYAGCIVARRTVRFIPHTNVDLAIDLTTSCLGFACDDAHTCSNGSCVDNFSPPPNDPDASAGAVVRCGDVFCPTSGQVCCLTYDVTAGTATGACKDPSQCFGPSTAILYCDDNSDCASAGNADAGPGVCCLAGTVGGFCNLTQPTGSQCLALSDCVGVQSASYIVCETGQPCTPKDLCGPFTELPTYHVCCAGP